MERERLLKIVEKCLDGEFTDAGHLTDLINAELAAEKPAASGELVEELRGFIAFLERDYKNQTGGTKDAVKWILNKAKAVFSHYSERKEVVLGEGQLIQFIDQTGRPSYFCATRCEGKRGKLVFVEEEGK